ncbi:ribonuclease H-like domain-containing protein [Tanacetum coccineum]|uniref:Ribonuclease H-like domain-containing protein n=1 Tax=Tanacetum coccineum TaxID=301880 RepID=A0ABQ5H3J4_9ASTR
MVNVRCLLNLVLSSSWHVFQLDVNSAFLYGDLNETVYMKLREGYYPTGDNKFDKGVFLALLVYVDDIIITGNSVYEIDKFKLFLKSKFMIKDMESLNMFLGLRLLILIKIAFKILRYLKGASGLGVHIVKDSADVALANNLLDVLTRYFEQMRSRGPEMLRVESLPADPCMSYGLHTLQRTIGNDMRNSGNLVAARNDLL